MQQVKAPLSGKIGWFYKGRAEYSDYKSENCQPPSVFLPSAMLFFISFIVWLCVGLLFYTYAGYGLFLALAARKKPGPPSASSREERDWPAVTLLIPAYNEAASLPEKISNSRALHYPGRLQVCVVSDGSDDNTAAIMNGCPGVQWLHQSQREGKFAALRRGLQSTDTPLVVFTDANTLLPADALLHLILHFDDPAIGGVAGEKKIRVSATGNAVGAAEGWYWRYESWIKKKEAAWYTVMGAAGELFAIRRSLFPLLPDTVILDDFMISMHLHLQGYRIAYEPRAFATEPPSPTLAEERKRKVRIAAGAYQAMGWLFREKALWRRPRLVFLYVSRRLFKWVAGPLALILLFLSTSFLSWQGGGAVYDGLLYAQLSFYGLALAGCLPVFRKGKTAWLLLPGYFVFMQLCQLQGGWRYLTRGQSVRWEKTVRQAL
jgi:cellulose synthase/poly-beta-1,6-N-acetylglucosamine synthase-like glycosyltransferase